MRRGREWKSSEKKKPAAAGRKPNSVRLRRPCGRLRRNDHSSSPVIADGIKRPTRRLRTGRPERLPIWPCSVRGFACHPCCHERGALLPHLFTLTLRLALSGSLRAVCFLCHFPSGCPDRALPGALPCGVRTFLVCDNAIVWPAAAGISLQPSFSCVMPYCSSFL